MKQLSAFELTLGYENQVIIDSFTTCLRPGEITTLVGPNGCGKSTLLRGLARLLKPNGGSVLLDGKSIHQIKTKDLARQLGILPQGPTAPDGMTVHELVSQGRYPHQTHLQQWSSKDEEACTESLQITDLTALADRPIDTLSGGQRQRAWIAMALAQQTSILLLDEPTTFLDLGFQLDVMETIQHLNREKRLTILLVLHDLNQAARYSDSLLVLDEGQVVKIGTPTEVITEELVAQVFNVRAQIITDAKSGGPVCIPISTLSGRDTAND